jgi:two-component system, NtrC family, sensor kinase
MAERAPKPKKAVAPRQVKAPKAKKLVRATQAAVMQAALDLSRQLSLEVREEELVGTFAATLGRLLPGRYVCLRVVDPRTLELTSMIADGPLASRDTIGHEPLAVKRSALKRTRLPETISSTGRIAVVDAYQPIFAGTKAGFSVPLVASGELFGLCNVEYAAPNDLTAADEPALIPLANQLSVALRNSNLLGEARYYRDYLRKVIDVAPALIVVADREGKLAVMNRAMQRYLGVGPEVIGVTLDQFRQRSTAPEPRLSSLIAEGLQGIEHTDREVVLWRDETQELGRGLFNTSVLRSPDGSIDGVIAIGQEIERVRSLERQVIQAEKLATLGQLAAGVVHELNNPLTSISVYGDYLVKLLEKVGERGDVDKANKVVEGAHRIGKLTRDLMSYARPSGEMEWVALDDVVKQALVFCEHVIKRADANVVLQLEEGLPRVKAIRAQLHQVLINLVTNACHALPEEGQTLTLATSCDGDCVRITVADTGIGIDAATRVHVFEPFFTTKKDGKGTGLGLSIVKNIVEGHGGTVGFESQVGAGTKFVITLPVTKENDS